MTRNSQNSHTLTDGISDNSPMSEQQTLATYADDQEQFSTPESERYKDPDWLRERYVLDRMSMEEIANECGVGISTISRWLKKHGIPTRSTTGSRLPESAIEKLRDEAWLRREYVENRQNLRDLADELNISTRPVREWLQKHGISTRSSAESRLPESAIEKLRDETWLREQYIEERRSALDIANELNASDKAVRNWLRKYDIDVRSHSESQLSEKAIEKLRDEDWVREQYVEQRRTTVDIANELNVSDSAVRNWLRKYDIDVRSHSKSQLSERAAEKLRDEEWMREQYVEQRRITVDIANELNITTYTVREWLQRHDIVIRGYSEATLPKDTIEKLRDEGWMQEQYVENRQNLCDLADELNISTPTVREWLQRHDIVIRGYSEANLPKDAIEKLRDEGWMQEQYVEQRRTTVDIADQLNVSNSCVQRWLQRCGIDIRNGIQNPEHLDHKVRSSWELEIANLLTKHDISYEYEAIEISWRDGRIYTPDFITEHYVIEIKGRLYPGNYVAEKAEAAIDTLDARDYVLVARDSVAEQVPHDIHISWDEREDLIDLLKED